MARDPVGLELLILTTLLDRPRDAYGLTISERVAERSGRERNLGTIYKSLDRLEEKGFISSSWGEPTAERGGRRKRYYRIEASGQEVVRRARDLFSPMATKARA